jgi:hypothetical protein
MTGDRSLRDYDLEAATSGHRRSAGLPRAARLAHPDEGVRRQEPLRVNSRLTLGTAPATAVHRPRHHESSGLTSAFGGNLAIMDIYAARRCSAAVRKFDSHRPLAVKPGQTIAQGRRRSFSCAARPRFPGRSAVQGAASSSSRC